MIEVAHKEYSKDPNGFEKLLIDAEKPFERIEDGKLRHPANSPAWKLVDFKWLDFGSEPRNLRLALSADEVNPHGPKQPGDDIGTYLAPLIEDLKLLWENGVEFYDVYREVFNLRMVLLWTINDFPAYGMLLDIPGKSKDGLNARRDLVDLKLRSELAPISSEKKIFIPHACYTLTKEEKRCVLKTLSRIKLFLIAIRSVLPKHVRYAITRLCIFFNSVCNKVLDAQQLEKLEEDIVDPSDVRWSVVLTPPQRDFEDRYNDDELGDTILRCEGIPNDMPDVDFNNDLDDNISTYPTPPPPLSIRFHLQTSPSLAVRRIEASCTVRQAADDEPSTIVELESCRRRTKPSRVVNPSRAASRIKELTFKFSGSVAGLFGDSFPFLGVDSIEGHNRVSGKGFPTTGPRIKAGNVVIHRGLHVTRPLVVACVPSGRRNCVRIGTDVRGSHLSGFWSWSLVVEGRTRLIYASFGSTRLICASFGITRLIGVSFGITKLICAFYGTTRLLCRVRAQLGADRREAGRMREGHMDASDFLIASADVFC
ncbi:transposase [Cucumis melo var. makuwa]|uniref:Transposase n=1 Tax=Cucumis melo var. makuwa TaxID=1194695 RepID=A0A5D3C5F4_CUCMM|nr:transposase [Cucumis melo var. makuwa]